MAPRAHGAGLPVAAIDWLACPVDGTALGLSVVEPSSGCAVAHLEGGPARSAGTRFAARGSGCPPERAGTAPVTCEVGGGAAALQMSHRTADRAAPVVRGTLLCSMCARRYPIEDGIPRLLPDAAGLEAAEAEGKQAERRQRDREAGIYDRNLFLRLLTAAEAPATLGRLRAGLEDVALEVGCGTGRFTARLAGRTRALLALDHSVESLRIAREKVGDGAVFVQADASYLPVRTGWATRVLSCQMLEHIPTAAARRRAVHEMARALAPGGRLVLSAYYHPPLIGRWLPKEGRHSGEIYFYRFARAELADLLGERLRLRGITGRLVYILLAHGLKPSTP